MPSARHAVYLNAGTWGPLPTRAADAMRARIDDVEARGRIGSAGYAEFQRIREAARAALAESMASDPERIALTHSTSGGINLVLGGMAFADGDEVVTTDNEHPGLLEPLGRAGAAPRRRRARGRGAARRRCARRGLGADRPAHPARRALARALGERPRAAAARDLRRRARRRRNGDRGRRAGRGCDRRRSGRARRGRLRRARPEMAVRAERRRLPVGRGRLRGAVRGRSAELLHARLPQRGAAVLAGRPPTRRRLAHDVPALAGLAAAVEFRRELVGWREGALQMASRARALRRAALGGARRDDRGRQRGRRAARRIHRRGPLGGGCRDRAGGATACSRARCPGSTGCASRSATGSRTATSSASPPRCARWRRCLRATSRSRRTTAERAPGR